MASSQCFLTWILAEKKTDKYKDLFCLEIDHLGMRWPISKKFIYSSKQNTSKRNLFSKLVGSTDGHKGTFGCAGNVLYFLIVVVITWVYTFVKTSNHTN